MISIPKDPIDWLALFRQQVDVILNHLSSADRLGSRNEQEHTPLVDIFETADSYVLEFELPGFERCDLKLSVCCNTLLLEGVKRREKRKGCRYVRVERHFGHFSRMVEVPPQADIQGIRAVYDRGTLSVILPRRRDSGDFIREIPIQ